MSTSAVSSLSHAVSVPTTLQVLLRGLVDYAGLFPPAGVSMPQAVENYARYRGRPEAFALGRFVAPTSRLSEFLASFNELGQPSECWRISALLDKDPEADLAAIRAFNRRNEGRVIVDAVEAKVATDADIVKLGKLMSPEIAGYCEIPSADPGQLLDAVQQSGMRAKIRTGGLTPDAFPDPALLADFLYACATRKLAFKATAGLHHPLRSDRPLTYEPDAPCGTMHGFLNFFLGAALAYTGATRERINLMLSSTDAEEFKFRDLEVTWRDQSLSLLQISQTRASFAISFGSCSFEEPISDLLDLRLLCIVN